MIVKPFSVSEAPQREKSRSDSVAIAFATACTIALGVGCSLGFALGGLHLMGDSWMQYNEFANSYFTMTPVSHAKKIVPCPLLSLKPYFFSFLKAALVGVYLVMASVALGPSLLGLSVLSITRLRPHFKNNFFLWFLTVTITAGIITCAVLSGVYLIEYDNPYIWYQPLDGVPMLNTLNQLCGCLLVSAYSVLSVAAICSLIGSLKRNRAAALLSATDSVQPNNKFAARLNLMNYGVLLSSFSLIFLLTLFLPHVWAITYMSVIAWNAYFVQDSPYSLISGVILYQNQVEHYSFQNISYTNTSMNNSSFGGLLLNSSDSMQNSTYTLLEYLPDPNWLQPMVFLKLYQTVVVYYSIILLIVLVGTIGTYYAPLRRHLHHRVNMWFIPKSVNLWPVGASIGMRCLRA